MPFNHELTPANMNAAAKSVPHIVLQPALDSMAENGYAIIEDFMPRETISALAQEAKNLKQDGNMRLATTGKNLSAQALQANSDARGDYTYWLGETAPSLAQMHYLERMEALRTSLNQTLYLGLFDAESHFAIYPPGAIYRKHLDQFRRKDGTLDQQRQVSSILYLNTAWQPAYGGELRIYMDDAAMPQNKNHTISHTVSVHTDAELARNSGQVSTQPGYLDIQPNGGTLVMFLSGQFFHEVLPSTQTRISLTGWFRQRNPALP